MALQTHTVTVRIRGERPGIGAVVAMVAAARMVLGGWSTVLRRRESPVTHWDFVPAWMTTGALPACGDYWPFDYGIASGIEDVNCPDCIAIARWAGVLMDAHAALGGLYGLARGAVAMNEEVR